MIRTCKNHWRELRHGRPGHRFADFHACRQQTRGHLLRKPLAYFAGTLLVLTGIVMLPLPGPGLLVIVIGLAFLASESRHVAAALDRFEVAFRRHVVTPWRRRRARRAADVPILRR